jgi:hypothetical protein
MSEKQQIILPPEDGGASDEQAEVLVEKPDLDAVMNGVQALKEVIPIEEQIECCANCRFYLDSMSIAQKGKQGFCRRYPPTVFVLGMQQTIVGKAPSTVTQSNFPPMAANGWCGDFALRLVQ